MRKSFILAGAAAALVGCGQSGGDNAAADNRTAGAAAPAAKPAYCFFKDAETKGWKASVDKSGNVLVTGKAYREDSRYKALLGPPTVNGETAEVAPTIGPNDTGFAAPGNWWDLSATIPDSADVKTVTVKCGDKTVATLTVPRKK